MWDYPRPPAIVDDSRDVQVFASDGTLIAACNIRSVCWKLPVRPHFLPPVRSTCRWEIGGWRLVREWKGQAEYFQYQEQRLAWRYLKPTRAFAEIAGWYAFYPAQCRCVVAGQNARAQAGGFYGGWVTDEIVGPYKGEPGRSDGKT